MAARHRETQEETRTSAGNPDVRVEQDIIITEDGEIIPRRTTPYVRGQVIFEEPSLG